MFSNLSGFRFGEPIDFTKDFVRVAETIAMTVPHARRSNMAGIMSCDSFIFKPPNPIVKESRTTNLIPSLSSV